MSQTDIENLKAGFDAYNDGDFERLLELWDEEVEVVPLVGAEPLRGKSAARKWLIPETIDQRGQQSSFETTGGVSSSPVTGTSTGGKRRRR